LGIVRSSLAGSGVTSVAFSPDGQRVISGSEDKTVHVWDLASGTQLLCLRGHEDWVTSVAYSPDGQRIVSGSGDKTVRVWDAASGAPLLCLRGHQNRVISVAFSPDGKCIVSGSEDQTVWLWDVAGCTQHRSPSGHETYITSVTFTPDGLYLISESSDQIVRVWDATSGICLDDIERDRDVVPPAPGARQFPLRAISRGLETVIESSVTKEPVAWFPTTLYHITSHPSGRCWAGSMGNYLCLFTHEGGW
jgi:WD40 repeat protein